MIEKAKYKVGDVVNGSVFKWHGDKEIVDIKEYKLYDGDNHVKSVWHYKVGNEWYTDNMLYKVR